MSKKTPPPSKVKLPRKPSKKDAAKMAAARIKAIQTARRRFGNKPAADDITRTVNGTVDAWHALELRSKGLTWYQVGQQMKCSHVHARQVVLEAVGELDLRSAASIKTMLAQETLHLDELRRATIPLVHGQIPRKKVLQPAKGKTPAVLVPVDHDPLEVAKVQLGAIARATSISQRVSALHGLDAPVKTALTDPSGDRPYSPYEQMSTEDLAKAVEDGLREVGLTAIDITPPATPSANGKAAGRNGHKGSGGKHGTG